MNSNNSKLITVREFARRTGISYNLARTAVANGQVPSVEIGRMRRLHEGAVEEFFRRPSPSLK